MKALLLVLHFVLLVAIGFSQPIPSDSLYLGQTPPIDTPAIFKLQITDGLIAAERIAITSNGSEIYYGELNSWPATIQRIKCYRYLDNKWQGPFVAFEGYIAPSLSVNDSIIYMQKTLNNNTITATYFSVRNNSGWTEPVRLLSTNLNTHYFQQTNLNNYYTASVSPDSLATNSDLCKLVIHGSDTAIQNLGKPINTPAVENDFYIARNESYIIFCRFLSNSASDLYISYRNGNGSWTMPVGLGPQINTPNPNWECCPFVTHNGKYLFFMRGGNQMSSYHIYWVSIDKLIEGLKATSL